MKHVATTASVGLLFLAVVTCQITSPPDTGNNTVTAVQPQAGDNSTELNTNTTGTSPAVPNSTVSNQNLSDTTQQPTANSTTSPEPEPGSNSNETQAREFLEFFNVQAGYVRNNSTVKEWTLDTNITDFNEAEVVKQQSISAVFDKEMRKQSLVFNDTLMSPDVRRQLSKIRDIGTSAQPNSTKVEQLSQVLTDMSSIYGKATVCLTKDECLPLEPDITRLMATSEDYNQLLNLWTGWRNATGKKMKDLFTNYVKLSNEAVQFLGYKDLGEEWRSGYESDTFVDELRDIFDQVRPLYEQLHAYVRRKLKAVFGADKFPASGHIPAHLLGNMWAQEWDSRIDKLKPYVNATAMDVTAEMVKQNYSVVKIFRTSENFFQSLGFEPMVDTFWNLSMLEKPADGRDVVCHASAWDFYDQKDFRIKMCTDITQQDLMTVHHEMGHIAYYMQYRDQPVIYRDGANDGFHEAVGDVMALSVQTPEHMKILNLIPEIPQDNEADINFLLNMALQKVAFLPFGYLIDQWRWSVFNGESTPKTYNKDWWDLRCHLQGVSPPVARTEDDFDPGAKYHVAASVPYLRYFISFIVQFQFHQAACLAANHAGPLHRCDIYNQTASGQKLREMLQLGSSQPWQVAMKTLTGQEKMSAEPLMEYFKPLLQFLRQENGNDYGWAPDCPSFTNDNNNDNNQGSTVPTCRNNRAGERAHMSWLALVVLICLRFL